MEAAAHARVTATLRGAGCVFAEEEARLLIAQARTGAQLAELVAHRLEGQPLEHVLGWVEFCGMKITVAPRVFVPRRRTEAMVAEAGRLVAGRIGTERPVVVDVCCGCGAVGVAIAESFGPVELHLADIDDGAVACAAVNVADWGQVHQGDLFQALPATLRGRVAVLVANVPYVPSEAIALMPPEARLHEPRVALDGGADGLDVMRRVAADVSEWLAPGGHVLVETSLSQVAAAVRLFVHQGLDCRTVRDDDRDATVIVATRPRRSSPAVRNNAMAVLRASRISLQRTR